MIRKANINDTEGLIKLLFQVHALHAKGRPDIFKPGGIKYTKENISEILKNENTPVFVFANDARLRDMFFVSSKKPRKTLLYKKEQPFISMTFV